jgi:hypothetical protein
VEEKRREGKQLRREGKKGTLMFFTKWKKKKKKKKKKRGICYEMRNFDLIIRAFYRWIIKY